MGADQEAGLARLGYQDVGWLFRINQDQEIWLLTFYQVKFY